MDDACYLLSITSKTRAGKCKSMEDEYNDWDELKYYGNEQLGNINDMSQKDLHPGLPVRMWEWYAGSGRLSSKAWHQSVSHLPPVDYRWGVNVGFCFHQVTHLWDLLVYPIDVLYASPTCTPWSTNSRQWDR